MSPLPKPISSPAPLGFAIVWIAFTLVHAGFMLGAGKWGTPDLLAMLLFYALFLGIGVYMARSALRWRRFVRTFGTPSITSPLAASPGEPIRLALRFDRAWPLENRVAATLEWAAHDRKGNLIRTFDTRPLSLSVERSGGATLVHATGVLPVPSAEALAAQSRPELHLHENGLARLGWRLGLPTPRTASVPMTPEDAARTARVLGRIALAVALAAAGILAWMLAGDRPTLFGMMFPLALFLVARLMWQVRRTMADQGGHDANAAAVRDVSLKMRRTFGAFGVLAFIAFAADAFLPHLGATAPALLARMTGERLRPAQPARFTLPPRMFNGQNVAMDVEVKGSGELDGDRLTLAIDELRIGEMLSRPDTERLHATKVTIEPVDDAGEHVTAAGSTHAIPLDAPGPGRAWVLKDIQASLTLAPHARLDRIWLRLGLHHGSSYTPIDATPGHLAKLVSFGADAFDTCKGTWTMGPRAAIEQQCNGRLAETLANPLWRLLEQYQQWRNKDNLILLAFQSNNIEAIRILHAAGVPVDGPDERGRTALMLAAWNNRRDAVEALVAAGADPYFQPRPRSHSALSGAIYDGYTETARLMLEDTAVLDRQAPGFGFHPAHLVVARGHAETLRLLLERGLSVDSVNTGPDARGETLLMEAARSRANSIEIAHMLLERGARLDAKDRLGKNATDWAEFFGNRALSDLLCARGLEPTPPDASEQHKRASCAQPSQATGFRPDRDYR